MPISVNTVPRRGSGGRGWRHRFYATGLTARQRGDRGRWRRWCAPCPLPDDQTVPTREQQISMLQADVHCLQQHAELLRHRIEELNAQGAERPTP